jgi:hypothetical protein
LIDYFAAAFSDYQTRISDPILESDEAQDVATGRCVTIGDRAVVVRKIRYLF